MLNIERTIVSLIPLLNLQPVLPHDLDLACLLLIILRSVAVGLIMTHSLPAETFGTNSKTLDRHLYVAQPSTPSPFGYWNGSNAGANPAIQRSSMRG